MPLKDCYGLLPGDAIPDAAVELFHFNGNRQGTANRPESRASPVPGFNQDMQQLLRLADPWLAACFAVAIFRVNKSDFDSWQVVVHNEATSPIQARFAGNNSLATPRAGNSHARNAEHFPSFRYIVVHRRDGEAGPALASWQGESDDVFNPEAGIKGTGKLQ